MNRNKIPVDVYKRQVVDGMIVGNILGPDALAAVNLVLPVTLLFNTVYVLFGVGGSTLFSVALGERDHERARQLFTVSVGAMVVTAVMVLFIGLFLCRHIAQEMCIRDRRKSQWRYQNRSPAGKKRRLDQERWILSDRTRRWAYCQSHPGGCLPQWRPLGNLAGTHREKFRYLASVSPAKYFRRRFGEALSQKEGEDAGSRLPGFRPYR